jgi:hypothetical protein
LRGGSLSGGGKAISRRIISTWNGGSACPKGMNAVFMGTNMPAYVLSKKGPACCWHWMRTGITPSCSPNGTCGPIAMPPLRPVNVRPLRAERSCEKPAPRSSAASCSTTWNSGTLLHPSLEAGHCILMAEDPLSEVKFRWERQMDALGYGPEVAVRIAFLGLRDKTSLGLYSGQV